MFERYTEKARRVIFFARYEASQYGSPVIDTEHLLLGILRETEWGTRMLPAGAAQAIRTQIEKRTPSGEKISTSIDLPLSNDGKRVLAYGAEEADRLNHHPIGPEHLFVGLLREERFIAAQLLVPYGVQLKEMRTALERAPRLDTAGAFNLTQRTFTIHGASFDLQKVRGAMSQYREHNWQWLKQPWTARDVVIHRGTAKVSFDLSLADDSANFELVKGGWKKDHCGICQWELFESKENAEHGVGYTNGRDWICTECYEKFWSRPDFISGSYSELT